MITRVNKSKTLSKYISGTCKCKFYSKKYNSNNDKCRRDCQNPAKQVCEKSYIWNSSTCTYMNSKSHGVSMVLK